MFPEEIDRCYADDFIVEGIDPKMPIANCSRERRQTTGRRMRSWKQRKKTGIPLEELAAMRMASDWAPRYGHFIAAYGFVLD